MARARQPVSIDGLEFDALISEDLTLEATVPEYAVESGFTVSDAIVRKAATLSMVLFVSNTPVTWASRHGTGRVNEVVARLEELYYNGTPVTVITTDKVYSNMAIESITFSKRVETGYDREIPISFRQVRTTAAKTTTIPDSYGKSGATGASAGTANTSEVNPAGSDGTTSGEEGSADEDSGNSILAGVADMIGSASDERKKDKARAAAKAMWEVGW